MATKCTKKNAQALYSAALKADATLSRELKRVYGARRAGDARYYYPSNPRYRKDAKLERAAKAKLRADACLRKSWGRDN